MIRNKFDWHSRFIRSGLRTTVLAVGCYVWDESNKHGRNAHPGRDRIAGDLRLSTDTVDRALAVLRDTGWIARVTESNRNPHRSWADVYELTYAPGSISDDDRSAPVRSDTPDRSAPVRSQQSFSIKSLSVCSEGTEPAANGTDRRQGTHTRADLISENWQPSVELLGMLRERCPGVDVAAEVPRFITYNRGKGYRWADWSEPFTRWCERAVPAAGAAQRERGPRVIDVDAVVAAVPRFDGSIGELTAAEQVKARALAAAGEPANVIAGTIVGAREDVSAGVLADGGVTGRAAFQALMREFRGAA